MGIGLFLMSRDLGAPSRATSVSSWDRYNCDS